MSLSNNCFIVCRDALTKAFHEALINSVNCDGMDSLMTSLLLFLFQELDCSLHLFDRNDRRDI